MILRYDNVMVRQACPEQSRRAHHERMNQSELPDVYPLVISQRIREQSTDKSQLAMKVGKIYMNTIM